MWRVTEILVRIRSELEELAAVAPSRLQPMLDGLRSTIDDMAQVTSSERVETLIHSMMDSLMILDGGGVIRYANPATDSLLGYPEHELIGRRFAKLVADEQTSSIELLGRHEMTLVAKSGKIVPVLYSGGTLHDDGALPEAVVCILSDLTEQKRSEQKARQYQSFADSIVATVREALVVLDGKSRVLSASPSFYRLFDTSPEETIGYPLFDLAHAAWDLPMLRKRFLEIIPEQKTIDDFEIEYVSEGMGRRRMLLNARQIQSPPGTKPLILLVIEDITQRKQIEEELRQAQKMEAIGTMASGVAHDFNNLLMGISGVSDIAIAKAAPDSQVRAYLDEIKKSAKSGAAITKKLLDFSRKQPLQPSTFRLYDVLESWRETLNRLLGDSIRIQIALQSQDDWIRADPQQVEQILMNLAVNARDAMPRGGCLTIETRNVILDRPTTTLAAGNYVALVVTDTGVGMSDATRARIFDPFFTTKELGQGTGLGLWTVYGIVKQWDGEVRVESRAGQGTTFEILFPQHAGAATEQQQPASMSTAVFECGKETILVVEDERLVRMSVAHYLEQAGYRVLQAKDGQEAIAVSKQFVGAIDALLTDMSLPDMDGARVAAALQGARSTLKVIFMSAHWNDWLVDNCGLEGGTRALQKPFSKEELLERMRATLAGTPASESLSGEL